MKIVLYGAMANNMYVFARCFAERGDDVLFVRDRDQCLPLAQPSWEDSRATLPYEKMGQEGWDRSTLTRWEEDVLRWKAPPWMVDVPDFEAPMAPRPADDVRASPQLPWPVSLVLDYGLRTRPDWAHIVRVFREGDVVMTCGKMGAWLGMASGRPHIIFAHGSDLRAAAGLDRPRTWHPTKRLSREVLHWLTGKAFRWSDSVATQDPKGLGGHIGSTEHVRPSFDRLLLPFPSRRRPPPAERRPRLEALLRGVGARPLPDDARIVGFTPSRQDFFWKGQDVLIRGLAQAGPAAAEVHLLMAGWGNDYLAAQELAARLGVSSQITFLPCALTKPYLYDFYDASDFVFDQLYMGTYGSSAPEAMAGSCPVMMNIDEAAFLHKGWEPPPVLNVKVQDDIARVFAEMSTGSLDLELQGRTMGDWCHRHHGPDTVLSEFDALARRCIESRHSEALH